MEKRASGCKALAKASLVSLAADEERQRDARLTLRFDFACKLIARTAAPVAVTVRAA